MTNNISLDELATNTPYDIFSTEDLGGEPLYRSVTFWKESYVNGTPASDFWDAVTRQGIFGLSVSQHVARRATTPS
jgi:hypothetical protein